MREIKYEAWDKKRKEMFPVHEIKLSPNGGHLIEVKGYDDWDKDGWTLHGGARMMYANEDRYVLRQYTGLKDKNSHPIFEGDVVSLQVDGEIRNFEVCIETVIRKVLSHPTFDDEYANVAITGVVFKWNGFELFPCVDSKGRTDNEMYMKVIGNIYENPELLNEKTR